MPYFIQYDENGKISGTVLGQSVPPHPRQLEFPEPAETIDMKVVDGNLVLDEEAIALREKQAAIQQHLHDLAAEKLEETAAKPSNWEDLTVQEKAEISLGQKK